MSVALTPELEKFVTDEVASGRYQNEAALIQESVRLLRQKELERRELADKIQAALDQVERGEVIRFADEKSADEYFAKLPERARANRNTKPSSSS